MIDIAKLNRIYADGGVYALQIEVGDVCDQGCSYCYMNALPYQKNALSDATITRILGDAYRLGIVAIEWLGGEPLLRPSIFTHLAHARNLGFRNNMWTGGLPLADERIRHKTAQLCTHGLIAVHVSTVDPGVYAELHPHRPRTDLPRILDAIEKLLGVGYPASQVLNSVTYTGIQSADDMIDTIDFFEQHYGITTCINVYHTYLRPGQTRRDLERFIPDRDSVARVYKRYARQVGVENLSMNCVNKQYCSATAAVLSDGSVTPCATIRPTDSPHVDRDGGFYQIARRNWDYLTLSELRTPANLPVECRTCGLGDRCWGCRSRAYACGNGLFGRDPRCLRQPQARAAGVVAQESTV